MTVKRNKLDIGGHDGMRVYRTEGGILKRAASQKEWEGLLNEANLLAAMSGRRLAPDLYAINHERWETLQEDLGECERFSADTEDIRHSMIHWLYGIRQLGIRHGDCTAVNVQIKDGRWIGIDWADSHTFRQMAPPKQIWSDTYLALRTFSGWDTPVKRDYNRIARRWIGCLESLRLLVYRDASPLPLQGQRFVEYGCYEGDMTALARAEGMEAVGIDNGRFRPGQNSIERGRAIWDGMGLTLIESDILSHPVIPADIAVCFSTWPYLVNQAGRAAAEEWLERVLDNTGTLFFEAQYEGDGPGLDTPHSLRAMFARMGATMVEATTLPMSDRPHARTVWKVTKHAGEAVIMNTDRESMGGNPNANPAEGDPVPRTAPSDDEPFVVPHLVERPGVPYQSDPEDGERFRRSAIRSLGELYRAGVRHGNISPETVVIQGDEFYLAEDSWGSAHRIGDTAPRQAIRDSFALADVMPQMGLDGNRVWRRWRAVLQALKADTYRKSNASPLEGKTIVDYGCGEGDFLGLALAEGMNPIGYDRDPKIVERAVDLWGAFAYAEDVTEEGAKEADVALCFSTWPYIVRDYGRSVAERWLRSVVDASDVLFFETQYEGDGPGTYTAEGIRAMFEDMNARAIELVSIPVTGRDAERTVWEVRSR